MSIKSITTQPSTNWHSLDATKTLQDDGVLNTQTELYKLGVYQEYTVDQLKGLQTQIAMLIYENTQLKERVGKLERNILNRDISCLG